MKEFLKRLYLQSIDIKGIGIIFIISILLGLFIWVMWITFYINIFVDNILISFVFASPPVIAIYLFFLISKLDNIETLIKNNNK